MCLAHPVELRRRIRYRLAVRSRIRAWLASLPARRAHRSCRSGLGARLFVLVALALIAATVSPSTAQAAKEYSRFERLDVEPYFAHLARVRIWINLVHLEGSLIDGVKPEDLVLVAGGNRLKQVPGISRFEYTGDEMDIVVMVNMGAGSAFGNDDYSDKIADFIAKLPKTARVAIVTYGGYVKSSGFDDPSKTARNWQKSFNNTEDESNPPRLLYALDKAVKLLTKIEPRLATTSTRKLIVLLSDGIDEQQDDDIARKGFVKLAKTASDAGIAIHSIGFSLVDNRRPLINLGEISKKTSGTFRWVRDGASFAPNLEALKAELRRQLVLTFYVPEDLVVGKTLKVLCKSDLCTTDPNNPLVSDPDRKAPTPRSGGAVCDPSATCIEDINCVNLSLAGGGRVRPVADDRRPGHRGRRRNRPGHAQAQGAWRGSGAEERRQGRRGQRPGRAGAPGPQAQRDHHGRPARRPRDPHRPRPHHRQEPDVRDRPRRPDGLRAARSVHRRRRRQLQHRRHGLDQRHVRQRPAHGVRAACQRRNGADRSN